MVLSDRRATTSFPFHMRVDKFIEQGTYNIRKYVKWSSGGPGGIRFELSDPPWTLPGSLLGPWEALGKLDQVQWGPFGRVLDRQKFARAQFLMEKLG